MKTPRPIQAAITTVVAFLILLAACSGGSTGHSDGADDGTSEPDGLCALGDLRNYTSGSLTWYTFAEASPEVNCGFKAHQVGTASSPSGDWVEHVSTGNGHFFGAMNETDYQEAAPCGACVEITREDTGRKVTVTIVDRCPECPPGHIDLSADAFGQLEDLDVGCIGPAAGCGHAPISWRYVPCPVADNITFRLQSPTNPWWRSFLVQNHRYPLAMLDIMIDGAWKPAERKSYNYWLVGNGDIGPAPWAIRLTDVNGSVVQWTIAVPEEGDMPSAVQFPFCEQ